MPRDTDGQDSQRSPEPWKQAGQYIRDADGEIVVRGKTPADARRIVAAVNATREIPTEALERWFVEDVSDAATRPNLDVEIEDPPARSSQQVHPPGAVAVPFDEPSAAVVSADSAARERGFLFERRVFDRRIAQRRVTADRRRRERRQAGRRS